MADEHAIARYRQWYRKLLRFYARPYRERFADSMEQTFNDLCRERASAGKGLVGFVLWMFVETSAGIIREHVRSIIMQNATRRLVVWAVVVALILMIPLVAMQFTEEVNWDLFDFVVAGALLFGVGLAYELIARRSEKTVYRVAFGVGLVTAFLLAWVNGAVGIIGSENQPANLMYGAVFAVGFIGSLAARFKPRGMAHTLFAAALVQLSVPVIALIIWPQISWGGAGLVGVFVLNAFFAAMFVVSALLFRHAADPGSKLRGRAQVRKQSPISTSRIEKSILRCTMTRDSTLLLKTVKYAAITLSALMVAGIATLMFLARGTGEDITGIVAPALLIAFLSSVVAILAAAFQKRVQKSIDIK